MSLLDIFAWIVLALLIIVVGAVIAALGIMPGRIARQRNHPWADAVAVASWATLIFGFVFWPVILTWAYVDLPSRPEHRS